jgi:lambda repressor-like predicted transcriptional regulator
MGMGGFAAEVRRFMKARGMSLRETARAAGYSDHTLLSKVLTAISP